MDARARARSTHNIRGVLSYLKRQYTEASPSQLRRLHNEDAHDVMPRRAAEPAADARTWPPACQNAHGRPPERRRRHWCCGSYKNNMAALACSMRQRSDGVQLLDIDGCVQVTSHH